MCVQSKSKGESAKVMSRCLLVLGAGSELALKVIEKEVGDYDRIIAHYYRSVEKIAELKEKFGEKIIPIQADFSSLESTERFVQELKKYTDIDSVLHLPANRIQYNKIYKTDWKAVQLELDVQLRSIWMVISRIMGNMIERKTGRIVFVLSSCTANVPPKFLGGYTTSKYALLGLMKALSSEYAEKGIMVNAVSPGMMDTKFLEFIPDFVKEDTKNKNPLKRFANPDDILAVIEMLLSDKNTFITGQNIIVNGGE